MFNILVCRYFNSEVLLWSFLPIIRLPVTVSIRNWVQIIYLFSVLSILSISPSRFAIPTTITRAIRGVPHALRTIFIIAINIVQHDKCHINRARPQLHNRARLTALSLPHPSILSCICYTTLEGYFEKFCSGTTAVLTKRVNVCI